LLLLHEFFLYIIFESSNTANDSSFDLSLQFNGYPIAEAKAELQKIAAFTAIEKENFIESKKRNCIPFK
jgi:hypothetical protein